MAISCLCLYVWLYPYSSFWVPPPLSPSYPFVLSSPCSSFLLAFDFGLSLCWEISSLNPTRHVKKMMQFAMYLKKNPLKLVHKSALLYTLIDWTWLVLINLILTCIYRCLVGYSSHTYLSSAQGSQVRTVDRYTSGWVTWEVSEKYYYTLYSSALKVGAATCLRANCKIDCTVLYEFRNFASVLPWLLCMRIRYAF